MTAQPSSQAEREDVARLCRERAASYGALRRSSVTAIALDRAADLLTRPDREHATPRSMPEEVVEAYERAAKVADAYAERARAVAPMGSGRESASIGIAVDIRALSQEQTDER